MSSRHSEFGLLLENIRLGDERAAEEFLDAYGPYVLRAVRRKLDARLRQKFDSVDFVQAVWASFFASCVHMRRFNGSKDLIAFLATLASNKVVDAFRKYLESKKHNLQRETSADDSTKGIELKNRDPSPSEVAIAREKWNQLLSGRPAHYQKIVQLRYEGHTYHDIAERLSVDERTVRRVLDRLFREQLA